MALTEIQRLRQALGESIPAGGTQSDTMFTDVEIQDFLDRASGLDPVADWAAYFGWVAKAAALANLVTTREGQSQNNFSDLHDAAIKERDRLGVQLGAGGYEAPNRSVIQRPIVRR